MRTGIRDTVPPPAPTPMPPTAPSPLPMPPRPGVRDPAPPSPARRTTFALAFAPEVPPVPDETSTFRSTFETSPTRPPDGLLLPNALAMAAGFDVRWRLPLRSLG